MFRNNNDFDEVAAYKREQELKNRREGVEKDSRFNQRKDYQYDEDFGVEDIEESYEKEYQTKNKKTKQKKKPNKNNKKNNSLLTIMKTIFTLVIFGSFFGAAIESCTSIFVSDDNIVNYEYNEPLLPLMEERDINVAEFIEEYEIAKNNVVKIDRISNEYLSGDYDKAFSINHNYLRTEYQNEYKDKYECLITVEDDYEEKHLLCARSVSVIDEMSYPSDFIDDAIANDVNMYDYQPYNSDYNEVYFINGYVYTREFIDLVIDWEKNNEINDKSLDL